MSTIRIDKILIGTSSQKVVVGDYTKVLKVVVGTPTSQVVISPVGDINNTTNVNTTGATEGDLLIYNPTTTDWEAGNVLNRVIVDGRVYPDSDERSQILIRRSVTSGDPLTLRNGEIAYSQLANAGFDGLGNGGERLYIGVGLEDSNGYAVTRHIIGGKYFTDLLNHSHGTIVPSSGVIVDSAKKVNEWLTGTLTVDTTGIIPNLFSDSAQLGNLTVTNKAVINQLCDTSLRQLIIYDSSGSVLWGA